MKSYPALFPEHNQLPRPPVGVGARLEQSSSKTSAEARLAWWQANKDKSPEQWLTDSLPILARQADYPATWDLGWFHEIVPDAPYGTDESREVYRAYWEPGENKPPFREQWVTQHREELRYDAATGCFRLPTKPQAKEN